MNAWGWVGVGFGCWMGLATAVAGFNAALGRAGLYRCGPADVEADQKSSAQLWAEFDRVSAAKDTPGE